MIASRAKDGHLKRLEIEYQLRGPTAMAGICSEIIVTGTP